MPNKPKRTGISFSDDAILERAQLHARRAGHRNFSAYVEWLIRRDLNSEIDPKLLDAIKKEIAQQTRKENE